MTKHYRTKTIKLFETKKLHPGSMKPSKLLRQFNPGLLLIVVPLFALISGCSFSDLRSIFATPVSESSSPIESTITRTLFVPQFSDTFTPSPTSKLDGEPALRLTWTPDLSTLQPTSTFLPTKTLRPTWTATITPTPTSTPQIGLLLTEDFSDPTTLFWIQKSETNWATWINNGVYVMHVKAPNVEISSGPAWLKINEVALEADVIRKQGHGYYGFACREVGTSYYTIFISTEGYFGFGETRGGQVTFLKTTPSQLIDTAINAVNHIRGECRGDTLTLYINGTWAGQQKVEGLGPGYVSMLTGTTWEQSQVVVYFDNLQIWTPADPGYHPRPTSTSTETPTATITATP